MTWMRLEIIILSEITQEWKTKHSIFSFISRNEAMRMQSLKNDTKDFGDSEGKGGKVVSDETLQIWFSVHCHGCTKFLQTTTIELA